ncbi:unnamed protein product [Vitrella brassicaformis CCMP3155]|uniref:Uncharacterized protein n=1 Tax=Vitrella brassicaformis (strain CCMP3155) TaxID=1169540 RepID=A0A0G4EX46_VITBC|nr:unnamed protein product [Vitrella brassicaformis CCMP3155]|eukprot:CEM03572.1 unnamed protein product [Vitrella brassicaformis CCMP3155]
MSGPIRSVETLLKQKEDYRALRRQKEDLERTVEALQKTIDDRDAKLRDKEALLQERDNRIAALEAELKEARNQTQTSCAFMPEHPLPANTQPAAAGQAARWEPAIRRLVNKNHTQAYPHFMIHAPVYGYRQPTERDAELRDKEALLQDRDSRIVALEQELKVVGQYMYQQQDSHRMSDGALHAGDLLQDWWRLTHHAE